MPKYHIGSNGPAQCRARIRPCPLGGESGSENHFDSLEEAEDFHQSSLQKEHGLINSTKKSTPDDELLKPISVLIKPTAPSVEQFVSMIESINAKCSPEVRDFYDDVRNGRIPEEVPQPGNEFDPMTTMQHSFLHSAIQECGFYGKFTKTVCADIAENVGEGVILDPMAGNGWAAKGLREAGVKTIASDDNSWRLSNQIEKLDALESLKKYGDQISHVLISWAPMDGEIDAKILREVRKNYPHVTIINIGEGSGGCTGSDEFWREANIVPPKKPVRYRTIRGLHDHITFVK